MKILAITQARYGSTRLPAKILKEVNGKTLLETHIRRVSQSKLISKVIVATTTEEGAGYILDVAKKIGVATYQGSVDDVLDRFYQAALTEMPDYVVRVTSDCPLIDPVIIDKLINKIVESGCDYASLGALGNTYPDGMDVEVFKFSALEKAWHEATLKSDREHVTPYIWRNGTSKGGELFESTGIRNDIDWSSERITVDTIEDFTVVKALIENLGDDKSCADYVNFLQAHPEIREINQIYERNEGYAKSLLNN